MTMAFTCPICQKAVSLLDDGSAPTECGKCLASLAGATAPARTPARRVASPDDRIELTCQKTGGKILLPENYPVILGRGAFGREVLRAAQVSNFHCSVDRVADGWVVKDLKSRNGTFVGERKLSCLDAAQRVAHGELLLIGRERFTVNIVRAATEPSAPRVPAPSPVASAPDGNPPAERGWRCSNCGAGRPPDLPEVCPACTHYNPWEAG